MGTLGKSQTQQLLVSNLFRNVPFLTSTISKPKQREGCPTLDSLRWVQRLNVSSWPMQLNRALNFATVPSPLDNHRERCILPLDPQGESLLCRTNRVISFRALWTCSS
jgi:hypothetical protein